MAFSTLVNRAKMTVSTAPGTGNVSLGVAATGYQTFANAGLANGNICSYVIEDGTAWEIGQGTYNTTGPALARTTIIASSNANAAISASANAIVFLSALAADIHPFGRATVADINYTVLTTNIVVSLTTLTATRTITLYAAGTVPPGTRVTIADETGNASATVAIVITMFSGDLAAGMASIEITEAFGSATLISNGVTKWSIA